jgi:hypothetical protein
MTTKGTSLFGGALAAIALFMQGTAFAQAHFTSTGGKVLTINSYVGDLYVKWAESGLSGGASTPYTIIGTTSASYACTTGGVMCQSPAQGAPGNLLNLAMAASGSGTVRQSLSLPPPPVDGSCACASGNLVLYQVNYGNSAAAPDLQICDETNPIAPLCAPVGGGFFTHTFCKLSSPQSCPPAP